MDIEVERNLLLTDAQRTSTTHHTGMIFRNFHVGKSMFKLVDVKSLKRIGLEERALQPSKVLATLIIRILAGVQAFACDSLANVATQFSSANHITS